MSREDTRRQWVDRAAAARHLGVGLRTIDRYTDQGLLRAYRVGPRGIRFDVAELDAFIEGEPVPARSHRTYRVTPRVGPRSPQATAEPKPVLRT